MDMQRVLQNFLSNQAVERIASVTKIDSDTVQQVVSAGLPVIIGKLGKNVSDSHEATNLDRVLGRDHDGTLLDDLGSMFGSPENSEGERILQHIFGDNKETMMDVVSKKTGTDAASVIQILSFVAPIALAYLGKEKNSHNLDAEGLADMLKKQTSDDGSLLTDLAEKLLDKDNDGLAWDDLLGGLIKRP